MRPRMCPNFVPSVVPSLVPKILNVYGITSQNANAFKSLPDFLGKAIAMNEAPLALEILKKIGETGMDSGCSTRERKEAILAALCAFEWDAGMSVVSDTSD